MSIHQTSVYLGTAGGWYSAGFLGERLGWRSPFWILGLAGLAYAVFLGVVPDRARSRVDRREAQLEPADDGRTGTGREPTVDSLGEKVGRIVANPAAALLLCVFVGCQFRGGDVSDVAADVHFSSASTWGSTSSSFTSTFWPLASLPGALCGGFAADWAARRRRAAGSGCKAWA